MRAEEGDALVGKPGTPGSPACQGQAGQLGQARCVDDHPYASLPDLRMSARPRLLRSVAVVGASPQPSLRCHP